MKETVAYVPTKKNIRERLTIDVMIDIYCKHHHDDYDKQARGEEALCAECRELAAYVDKRIEHCPLGEAKTTCKDCPVHCYSKVRREQIRQVMRFSGPRLMFTHPVLTFYHMKDGSFSKRA